MRLENYLHYFLFRNEENFSNLITFVSIIKNQTRGEALIKYPLFILPNDLNFFRPTSLKLCTPWEHEKI
jgi:hypothetical protein